MFCGFDGNTGGLLNGEVVFGSGLVANVSKRVELDPKKKKYKPGSISKPQMTNPIP